MKQLFSFACLLVLGLPAAAYFLNADSSKPSAPPLDRLAISAPIVHARRAPLAGELKLVGELLPVEQVEVISRLAGKVNEVRFKAGDWVPAGTVVAIIRADDLAARLVRHEAGVRAAESDLRARERERAEAEKLLVTGRDLARRDLIARREVEEAEATMATAHAEADLARAHLAQRQAMLAQAQALRSLTRLTAPISGQVTRRNLEPGAAIGEGGAVLTLTGLDNFKFAAAVSRADAFGVSVGAKARVSTAALPNKIFAGQISRVSPDESGANQLTEVEIEVHSPQRLLRAGMMVEATIELSTPKDALFIPRAAVISRHDSSYVYKVDAGRVVRQAVVVGPVKGGEIAVLFGLSDGDSIVADATDRGSRSLAEPLAGY